MAAFDDDHIIVASDKKWEDADAAPRQLYLSVGKSCTNCWENVAGPMLVAEVSTNGTAAVTSTC